MATADQILARVLVRCGWGSTNNPVSDAEILAFADDEIIGTLWPQLLASQGDWHLAYADSALVADQAAYRMPKRMWGPIKDLLLVSSDGRARGLSVVNIEELGNLDPSSGAPGLVRFAAYIDGDSIGLWPTPGAGDAAAGLVLRVRYYRRPNTLCLSALARQITAKPSALVLTLASTIEDWDNATEVDFVGDGVSHQVLAEDRGVTSVVATALTMDAAYPTTLVAGDWVTVAGTTPVAPIPDHMVPQLVSRVAAQCLNSNGDQLGFARNAAMATDHERRVMPTIEPRQEAEPRMIVPRNSPYLRWRR